MSIRLKPVYLLIFAILFTSCKFNPSVTSNKRKYQKGHYKPLREDVAGNSNTQKEQQYYTQNKKPVPEQKVSKSSHEITQHQIKTETNNDKITSDREEIGEAENNHQKRRSESQNNKNIQQEDAPSSESDSKFRHQANSIPKFTKIPLSFHISGLLALIAGVILVIYMSSAYLGLLIMAVAALLGLGSTVLSVIGLSIEKVRMHSVTTILLHSIMILLFLILMPLMILFVMTFVY